MTLSVAVPEALLILKILFVVLLYLFIWRIVRTASRDLRMPQESFVLSPQDAAQLLPQMQPAPPAGRLLVLASPALPEGEELSVDSGEVTIGRSAENDLALGGDEFASARHARLEPRPDGLWVADVGSTNGTFVNGVRIAQPRRLAPGDVLRVGETELLLQR